MGSCMRCGVSLQEQLVPSSQLDAAMTTPGLSFQQVTAHICIPMYVVADGWAHSAGLPCMQTRALALVLSGGQMFVRDQELLGAWTPASNGDEHDGWSQPVWLAYGTGAYANAFVPTVS